MSFTDTTYSPTQLDDDDVDAPVVEDAEDVDSDAPESASAVTASASVRKGKRRTPARNNAGLVRQAVEKTQAVEELGSTERDLLAAALGVNVAVSDIVVAIVSPPRKSVDIFTVLDQVRDGDEFESSVTAASLDKATLKAVWSFLNALDLVPATMPAAESKAGVAVARAIHGADADVWDTAQSVRSLTEL